MVLKVTKYRLLQTLVPVKKFVWNVKNFVYTALEPPERKVIIVFRLFSKKK